MGTVETISLMLGVAWASGINLYAAILVLGYFGLTGQITLPPELEILKDPLVMGAAGLMYFVEFFADKTPGVDTAWDTIHSFIRIPAGALLAAGAASGIGVDPGLELAAALVGGMLATGTHFTKAGTRILINTSPEPFSNWTASITEDVMVVAGLWTALNHPWAFIVLLVLFFILLIWIIPNIWRAIASLFSRIGSWFGGKPPENPGAADHYQKNSDTSAKDDKSVLDNLYHDASSKEK